MVQFKKRDLGVKNQEVDNELWIGYPIWWYTHPRIINTFFDKADLMGKQIHLFATSGGTGIDGSVKELRETYPGVTIVDGKRI